MSNPFSLPGPKKGGRPLKYPGLRETIISNETFKGMAEYRTTRDIAEEFQAPLSYVYRVRYLLGLEERPAHAEPDRAIPPAELKINTGAVHENVPILSAEDRQRSLSQLGRTAPPLARIQAIKALEEISKVSEQRVGPGPPLTSEDRQTRLARLLTAVPLEDALGAWEKAFNYRPHPPEQAPQPQAALQNHPGSLPDPPPEPKTPLRDLPEASPTTENSENGPETAENGPNPPENDLHDPPRRP